MVTINAQNDEKDILDFFKVLEQFVEDNKSAQLAPSISEQQDG